MGPEGNGPLLTLACSLRCLGPPSLSTLMAVLSGMEDYQTFLALVREFLPDREPEILRERGPALQVAAFASHFEDRYFPLDPHLREGMGEGYADLTGRIPIRCLGFTWDDYHDLDLRPGLLLMTYLLEDPWEGDSGARVPLGEACAEHVPAGLLQRIPEGGLSRAGAHRLDGTPYEGLALWADILAQETGTYFLDVSAEASWEEEIPWEREAVEALTQEWQRGELIQQKVFALVEWLEEDPQARLGELLDFLEE